MTDLGFIYNMGFPEPQNGPFQVMKRAITGHGTGCFLLQNRFFRTRHRHIQSLTQIYLL